MGVSQTGGGTFESKGSADDVVGILRNTNRIETNTANINSKDDFPCQEEIDTLNPKS